MGGFRCAVALVCCTLIASLALSQGEKTEPLIVVDAAGKDVPLAKWKLTVGAETPPWLVKAKGAAAPDYLAFRDDGSTTFVKGIVTYVPLSALKKLDYDSEKKSVTATLRTADKDATLKGTTRFKGINKLTIDGESDLKGLGKAAVKHHGGQADGIRGVRFPSTKTVEPLPKGRKAVVIAVDKEKSKHLIVDPALVYQVGAGTKSLSSLWFKPAVKIELAAITKLRRTTPPDEKKAWTGEFEVTKAGDEKFPLIINEAPTIDDAKSKLIGLYGRTEEGWKLIPLHTIQELTFE